MAKLIDLVLDKAHSTFGLIGLYVFLFMSVMALLQIFFRFTSAYIGYSGYWTDTLARFSLMILTLAGVPYSIRKNDHISIRPLLEYIPRKIKKVLFIISDIASLLLCIFVIISAFAILPRASNQQLQGAGGFITLGHAYAFFIIAFFFGAVYILERLIKVLLGREPDADVQQEEELDGNVPEAT
ncbi:TRAP transporter small permease [Natronorarus salvus]|uniref:TRAP transporter small permease n=1 Tax=Natronorarus salvus TaxID=3117733 RepID=UPI002F264393